MYARVATFEGDPGNIDKAIEVVRGRIEGNFESPPQGLEGVKETWMLVDREAGKGLGITLYDTEKDRSRADKALSAMTPPEPRGRRVDVSFYEVALHKERS